MVENYLVIKRNEVTLCTTTCMNLENIVLRNRNQTQRTSYCMTHLYERSRIAKSVETEGRLVVAQGWGWGWGLGGDYWGKCVFFFFFFIHLFILFIYFWLRWVFVAVHGLSLVAANGGYSSLRCVGFSLRWLLLLRSTGSRHVGFSSCGAWASSCGSRAQ